MLRLQHPRLIRRQLVPLRLLRFQRLVLLPPLQPQRPILMLKQQQLLLQNRTRRQRRLLLVCRQNLTGRWILLLQVLLERRQRLLVPKMSLRLIPSLSLMRQQGLKDTSEWTNPK